MSTTNPRPPAAAIDPTDHPLVHDVNEEHDQSLSPTERACKKIADATGAPLALTLAIVLQAVWIVTGVVTKWDPFPFTFLLTCSNVLQLILIFVLAVGQPPVVLARGASGRTRPRFHLAPALPSRSSRANLAGHRDQDRVGRRRPQGDGRAALATGPDPGDVAQGRGAPKRMVGFASARLWRSRVNLQRILRAGAASALAIAALSLTPPPVRAATHHVTGP